MNNVLKAVSPTNFKTGWNKKIKFFLHGFTHKVHMISAFTSLTHIRLDGEKTEHQIPCFGLL
jgi:hypothetical protein